LLLLALCCVEPPAARAQTPPVAERHCDGVDVHVQAANAEDAAAACEAARRALAFLDRYGLSSEQALDVELQARLPPGLRESAVGAYNRRSRRVTVLGYAEFLERGTWFGLPIDRELHRGAVAHEVAHAVIASQPGAAALALPAHEYIAYVVMFGAMEPALRERVLANFPGAGFDSEAQINSLTYAFDPMRFGASAWRHFRRQPDGRAYLARLVAGEIIRDEARLGD
jgi:hypothetical protein